MQSNKSNETQLYTQGLAIIHVTIYKLLLP